MADIIQQSVVTTHFDIAQCIFCSDGDRGDFLK